MTPCFARTRADAVVAGALFCAAVLAELLGVHEMQAAGIDVLACVRAGACAATPPATAPLANLPADAGQTQIFLTLGRSGVHERIQLTVAASDPLAQAYLEGRLRVVDMAQVVGSARVDDDDFTIGTPRVSSAVVTKGQLQLEIEDDPYHSDVGAETGGLHTIDIDAAGRARTTVSLALNDFRFSADHAFSRAPDVLQTATAQWNDLPAGAHVEVNTVATTIGAYAGVRAAIEATSDWTGVPAVLVRLVANLWIVVAVFLAWRCLPRRGLAAVRRPAGVLVGTVVAVVYGTALYAAANAPASIRVAALIGAVVCALVTVWSGYRLTGLPLQAPSLWLSGGLIVGASLIDSLRFTGAALILAPLVALALGLGAQVLALAPLRLGRAFVGPQANAVYAGAGIVSLLAITLACTTIPGTVTPQGVAIAYPGHAAVASIGIAGFLAPELFLFIAIALARGLRGRAPRGLSPLGVSVLLSIVTVGVAFVVIGVPVAGILSVVFVYAIALRSPRTFRTFAQTPIPADTEDTAFDLAVLRSDVHTASTTLRKLQGKFVAGDLSHDERDRQTKELSAFIDTSCAELSAKDPQGVFASLFTSYPLEHARAATRNAAMFGAFAGLGVLVLGFSAFQAGSATALQLPFVLLAVSTVTIMKYAVAAAAFVAFLPFLRGSIATTKGIVLGFAIALALVPTLWLSMSLHAALVTAAPTVLFFPLAGAVFDAFVLRRHLAFVSLPQIFSFANLGSFTAIGTVLASTIASVVTGKFHDAATSLVTGILKGSGH